MCVSAPVSFLMGAALLPLGAYASHKAEQIDRSYLPLAAFPLAFGIQQILEGIVWLKVDSPNSQLLYIAAFGFLFFSHFFGPPGQLSPPTVLKRTCIDGGF